MPDSDAGPEPISNTEVSHWRKNYQLSISTEEIDMIFSMDDAFRSATAEEHSAAIKRKQDQPPKPKRKF